MEIIGHRGAKGLAPENTLAGIQQALLRNVDWIEFDVRATKDGILVVLHDRTLLRVAKSHHRVRSLTFAKLRAIATCSGEAIPTFEDIMRAIGNQAKIDIELKSNNTAKKVVAEIQRQVKSGRPYSDFIISSFRPWLLREVQQKDPKIKLLLLQGIWPFLFMMFPGLKLSGVGFWRFAAPRLAVRLAKKHGLWTVISTINTHEEAHRADMKGIDAIITDVPQAFRPLWPWLVIIAIALLLLVWFLFTAW